MLSGFFIIQGVRVDLSIAFRGRSVYRPHRLVPHGLELDVTLQPI